MSALASTHAEAGAGFSREFDEAFCRDTRLMEIGIFEWARIHLDSDAAEFDELAISVNALVLEIRKTTSPFVRSRG